MKIIEDRYDGVIVNSDSLPKTCADFEREIMLILTSLKEKKLLWIKIPCGCSEFIPILTKLDFEFHHCLGNTLILVKKLCKNPIIPNPKNFSVGVGAIVLDGDELLVVKDRFSKGYKLPGGLIDPGETIAAALVREIFEETGITAEFEAIMNMGHFLKGQFEEQILYIVCTAKPKSKEITIYDSSEIVDARWMNALTFLNSDDVNAYNKKIVRAVIEGAHSQLTRRSIELRTPGELFL